MPKGEAVAAGIRASTGNQHVEVEELELGSLKHIRAFAQRFLARHPTLHILVNNAGVMACPPAKDGGRLRAAVRLEPRRPLPDDLSARPGSAPGRAEPRGFRQLARPSHVAGRLR